MTRHRHRKCIFKKKGGISRPAFMSLRIGTGVETCKHDHENSSTIKVMEVINYLSDYQFIKYSAPWTDVQIGITQKQILLNLHYRWFGADGRDHFIMSLHFL